MELPAGWAIATLQDLATADGVFTDGDWVESKDQDPDGLVRLVQLADIGDGAFRDRSNRSLTSEKATELNCTYLEAGDILIARMPAPLGRACLYPKADRPAVTVVDVCVFRAGTHGVVPRWLMWAINSPAVREQISSFQTGTTRKRISRQNLAKVQLWVPPIAEQVRIVETLDDLLSRLDAGERLVSRASRRSAALNAAITNITLGYEIGDDGGVNSAAAPTPAGADDGDLPRLPADWHWHRLCEIAEVVGGVTKDKKKQSDLNFPEVPYLRVANVQRGRLDLSHVAHIRVPEKKAKQLELQPGDVLLNEGGDRNKLGRGWIWEGQIKNAIHQNHVFRARILDDILHPKLLSWYANRSGRWFEVNGKQSVNLASISLSKIKMFPVPVPPVQEQHKIVERIEDQLSILEKADALAREALAKASALRAALLKMAFSGKLVPQDPTDEPASIQLARIQAERDSAPKFERTRRTSASTSPHQRRATAAPRGSASGGPPPTATSTPLPQIAVQQEFEL